MIESRIKKCRGILCLMALISLLAASCTPAENSGVVQKGDKAPNFFLIGIDGSEVELKEYRGRIVLLKFWAEWCSKCKKELPYVDEFYHQYKDEKDLAILTINIRDSKETVREYIKQTGLELPILMDTRGDVAEKYGVRGLPACFVLDREGTVVDRVEGTFQEEGYEKVMDLTGN